MLSHRRMNPGPGPLERRWKNRMIFRLTGRWPEEVVHERLLGMGMEHAVLRDVFRRHGRIWPPS